MNQETKVPDHNHCPICGKAIPPEEETCSPKCQEELRKRQRTQKITMLVFGGILVALAVVFVLSALS